MTSLQNHIFLRARNLIATITLLLSHQASADIVFNRDIRPTLSQHCFACHGPDAHDSKGELRLDTLEAAMKGGESGKAAIVPGKPEESELWKRIQSQDKAELMPPVDYHKELSEKQKKDLYEWIKQGAEYQGHWAFIAPQKSDLPQLKGYSNPIDQFVAARLKKEGLQLSKKAEPHVLLRRLSFDLTGLPAAFSARVTEPEDLKYEQLAAEIEKLLASPHFGERMALPWLDASRYADTNGYSIDGGRHAWIWRDWVIHAFNTNKPYDEFIIEQLAGDLLEAPTEAQRVATGFQRNNANTHEGGTIAEENLVNYVADRVKTLGESVLGLTTACSQCHDHKYDPLSQEEYFGLFAFFNTVSDKPHDGDSGVNSHPFIQASSVLATEQEIAELRQDIVAAKQVLELVDADDLRAWVGAIREDEKVKGRGFKLHQVKHLTATLPNGDPRSLVIGAKQDSLTLKAPESTAVNLCCEVPPLDEVHGLRVTFLPLNGKIGHEKKRGDFIVNTISPCFSIFPAKNIDHNSLINAKRITASSERAGYETEYIRDARLINGWSPQLSGKNDAPQHITFTLDQPVNTQKQRYMTTEFVFRGGGGQTPQHFKVEVFTGNDTDSELPAEVLQLAKITEADRSEEQSAKLRDYFRKLAPHKKSQRETIVNLEQRIKVLTEKHPTMVMDTAKEPRVTRFLDRGDYASPKHEVKPHTPSFLPPLETATATANRLDLARWLTRPDHPLTARVAVNNIWSVFFGRGLVVSRADFGSQGTYPSHPQLLDWLAVHFQESGWDVKELVRLIVSSETYQQQSMLTPGLMEIDPLNRFYARGPRFRLSAEHIRDQALAHSGLLVKRIGGPSVKTYHPGDLWRQVSHYGSSNATAQTYHRDFGENLYRRSLYTYWKRTLPPPSMAVFDAPNREVCSVGRGSTNTPLQAFILLNSPQFIEASRVLAGRALQAEHADDTARLKAIFTQVTGRSPKTDEMELLEKSLKMELSRYAKDEQAARQLIHVGDKPVAHLPVVKHAAWTNICQLILNLSETITRH